MSWIQNRSQSKLNKKQYAGDMRKLSFLFINLTVVNCPAEILEFVNIRRSVQERLLLRYNLVALLKQQQGSSQVPSFLIFRDAYYCFRYISCSMLQLN